MAKVNKDLLEEIMNTLGVVLYKLDELEFKVNKLNTDNDIGAAKAVLVNTKINQQIFEDNYIKLNELVKEFKGLVAIVRPEAKKSGWYGEEVKIEPTIKEIDYSGTGTNYLK